MEGINDNLAYIHNATVCECTKIDHGGNYDQFLKAVTKYGITFNTDKTVTAIDKIHLGCLVPQGKVRPDPERMKPRREMLPSKGIKSLSRVIGMFLNYSQCIPSF